VKKVQQIGRAAAAKARKGPASLKEALDEDTGSTVGALGVLGLAVLVAGAVIAGSEALPLTLPHMSLRLQPHFRRRDKDQCI
jgi:hypothetical protein